MLPNIRSDIFESMMEAGIYTTEDQGRNNPGFIRPRDNAGVF